MSDDKHLTGEEKRQRMKEQFKKELKERKEFADKVKGLRRMQSINKALENMSLEDDSDQWIDQLNRETAFSEAKVEMAMEVANAKAVEAENEAVVEEQMAMSEAEMQKIAAEQMVARMKAEMAAEAEGGMASPNLTGEVEAKEQVAEPTENTRLIEVAISEEGEVTSSEKLANSDETDKAPVRRMMGGALEEEEESTE